MASTRNEHLNRKVARLLAGKRQRQESVAMRLTGRAAELWAALVASGARLGLKPHEVMGLLLEHGGTHLAGAMNDAVHLEQGRK